MGQCSAESFHGIGYLNIATATYNLHILSQCFLHAVYLSQLLTHSLKEAHSDSASTVCRTSRRGRLQRRRRFKPKKNIFGGAWSGIYLIMGLASWLVWRQGGLKTQALPLCLYILQLGVNLFAWPPIFVGGQRRRYAVADSAGWNPLDALPAPPVCNSAISIVTPLHPSAAAHVLTVSHYQPQPCDLSACSSTGRIPDDDGQVLRSKPSSRIPYAPLPGLDMLCNHTDQLQLMGQQPCCCPVSAQSCPSQATITR